MCHLVINTILYFVYTQKQDNDNNDNDNDNDNDNLKNSMIRSRKSFGKSILH